ncbi:MAG: class I tRNA ligase family protein, partial [Gemmatimonadaceae bacterium]
VLRRGERTPRRAEVEPLVQMVAPFAPYLAEELWEQLGHATSVFDSSWPQFDPALLVEDEIELVVQVNGKVRGKIRIDRGAGQDVAYELAIAEPGVARFVTSNPKKVVFVPGRLLSIVV